MASRLPIPPLNGLPRLRIRLPPGVTATSVGELERELHAVLEPDVIERRDHDAVGVGVHPTGPVEHRDGPVAAQRPRPAHGGSG